MSRVELFGPPGVGKSATIDLLAKHAGESGGWLRDVAAQRLCARRIARGKFGAARQRRLGLALGLPKLGDLYSTRLCQEDHHRATGLTPVIESCFIEHTLERLLVANASLNLRIKSIEDFLQAVGQFAVYSQWIPDADVLVEAESLSHFGTRFAFVERPIEFAAQYCRLMPAPSAAVLFVADATTVATRIRKRSVEQGRLIPMHAGKSDRELGEFAEVCLAMCDAGAEALRQRGVPVLRLHVGTELSTTVASVRSFLSETSNKASGA